MYTLIADNGRGQQLRLTQNPDFTITNIDGLAPPDAIINTTMRAGHDGSAFNSAFVQNRQIILTIAINPPTDINRNKLYRFFRTARSVRLYYYNDLYGVYTDGWAQNAPVDFFAKKEQTVITLICPDPFWHGIAEVEGKTDGIESGFEFPFSIEAGHPISFSELQGTNSANIYNPGTYESGVIIEIAATGAAENPRIYHQEEDAFFRVITTLQAGDLLTIDTRTDHKGITLTRNGTKTNLISSRDLGSTWLQAFPGDNVFILSASSGTSYLTGTIRFITNVEGV